MFFVKSGARVLDMLSLKCFIPSDTKLVFRFQTQMLRYFFLRFDNFGGFAL